MHEPLIHILIPTYEPEPDFLRAALQSACTQTEKRWTLHINDDASVTDVHAIVEPYLKDPRITFTRNPHRLGIGGNWNTCLKKVLEPMTYNLTPNTYVQFLFQDDIWHPTYLTHMLHVFETHPTVGFVSTEHEYDCEKEIPTTPLYEELRTFRHEHIAPGPNHGQEFLQWWLERSLHPNIIGEPSFVMFRQSLIEQVGIFDEHIPQFLDVEYWTRCLAKADWYYLRENLGTFRVHAKGASEQNRREGRGMVDRLLCVERAIRLLPKNMRLHHINVLSRTLEEMIGKFRKENGQGHSSKNPLRLIPLFPFCLRHPLFMSKALFHAIRNT